MLVTALVTWFLFATESCQLCMPMATLGQDKFVTRLDETQTATYMCRQCVFAISSQTRRNVPVLQGLLQHGQLWHLQPSTCTPSFIAVPAAAAAADTFKLQLAVPLTPVLRSRLLARRSCAACQGRGCARQWLCTGHQTRACSPAAAAAQEACEGKVTRKQACPTVCGQAVAAGAAWTTCTGPQPQARCLR